MIDAAQVNFPSPQSKPRPSQNMEAGLGRWGCSGIGPVERAIISCHSLVDGDVGRVGHEGSWALALRT